MSANANQLNTTAVLEAPTKKDETPTARLTAQARGNVRVILSASMRSRFTTEAESEPVDSNELAAFVGRTLKLVGGF